MLSINTNLSSLIAQRSMKQSTLSLNTAIERMTTGFKINHSKDNAANYSITTNMDTKIGALQVAEDNAAMGLDLLTTASDILSQISSRLTRLRDLAVQVSNGTYGTESKLAINKEANALVEEINRLYSTAKYNGISLYDSAEGAGCDMESLPEVGASGFIKDVQRRDTTNMTTLASVDGSVALESGVYSISTPEELVKLSTMTKKQLIGADTEFVLANDIDLSGIANWEPIGGHGTLSSRSFKGTFDGNSYKITNLNYDTFISGHFYIGLFGQTENATIKNLGIENANITITSNTNLLTGVLVGRASSTTLENCYVKGAIRTQYGCGGLVGVLSLKSVVKECCADVNINLQSGGTGTLANFGGLVGRNAGSIMNSCAKGDIIGDNNMFNIGGLVGCSSGLIRNCYASGNVVGETALGGLVGWLPGDEDDKIGIVENCYSSGDITLIGLKTGSTVARAGGLFANAKATTIKNCSTNSKITTTMSSDYILANIGVNNPNYLDVEVIDCTYNGTVNSNLRAIEGTIICTNVFDKSLLADEVEFNLQIGINPEGNNSIPLISSIKIEGLFSLKNLGLDDSDYLEQIDSILTKISTKQVEYGATQNRLESALDEISTKYENLVSSRSTLRDADIADISSEYIRQQILQQASATLLATANQSASIALSLI